MRKLFFDLFKAQNEQKLQQIIDSNMTLNNQQNWFPLVGFH